MSLQVRVFTRDLGRVREDGRDWRRRLLRPRGVERVRLDQHHMSAQLSELLLDRLHLLLRVEPGVEAQPEVLGDDAVGLAIEERL